MAAGHVSENALLLNCKKIGLWQPTHQNPSPIDQHSARNTLFFYKNIFDKNIKAENDLRNFKNILLKNKPEAEILKRI